MDNILITNRLILRPFKETALEAVHSYASVPENVKYMIWGPNNEIQTKDFIEKAISRQNENPILFYDLAVTLKENNKLIGGTGIYLDNSQKQGEIGWILHRDYQRKGYGTELAKKLIRFGFENLKLHRITAFCDSKNHGSYKVMENCGMRREGHFVKSRLDRNGQWCDEYHYGILYDEWKSKNN